MTTVAPRRPLPSSRRRETSGHALALVGFSERPAFNMVRRDLKYGHNRLLHIIVAVLRDPLRGYEPQMQEPTSATVAVGWIL